MTILASLAFAATITFSGYVPPHLASDGARFQVAAGANADVPAAMRACRIDDFAIARRGDAGPNYEFAVPATASGAVQCLRTRLPAAARIAPLDHWITDAQAD